MLNSICYWGFAAKRARIGELEKDTQPATKRFYAAH